MRVTALLALALLPGVVRSQDGEALVATKVERVEVPSAALGGPVPGLVQRPRAMAPEARVPVVFFLHGLRGSAATWTQRGAHRILDGLIATQRIRPLVLVAVDGRNSFYMNAKGRDDARFGDFVARDLVAWTDRTLPVRPEARGRGLLGDSMGGFGALLHGFLHPDLFGAVAAHQPSVFPEDRSRLPAWVQSGRGGRGAGLLTALFGEPVDEEWWLAHNLFHLARAERDPAHPLPAIYFDVGKDDRYGLADLNQAFHALLEERKIRHSFTLREGSHGREFYIDNLPHSLAFLDAAFHATGAPAGGAPPSDR
jgi:S-formylglutathione hydrolase FrmB